ILCLFSVQDGRPVQKDTMPFEEKPDVAKRSNFACFRAGTCQCVSGLVSGASPCGRGDIFAASRLYREAGGLSSGDGRGAGGARAYSLYAPDNRKRAPVPRSRPVQKPLGEGACQSKRITPLFRGLQKCFTCCAGARLFTTVFFDRFSSGCCTHLQKNGSAG